jgi:hypothetical protein
MTPVEAVARGQLIASEVTMLGTRERDPIAVTAEILRQINDAVNAGEIPGHMSPEAVRGAAYHAALIVHSLAETADEIEAARKPRTRARAFLSRVAGYLGHRSAGDVGTSLCCAAMGAAEFTNGRSGWAALLVGVACLNLVCAWISYRRAKGSA